MIQKLYDLGVYLLSNLTSIFDLFFTKVSVIASNAGLELPDIPLLDLPFAYFVLIGSISFFIVFTLVKWVANIIT